MGRCSSPPEAKKDEGSDTTPKKFDSMDSAAVDFAQTYNDDSIRENCEYGSSIYQNPDGTYSYTVPRKGDRMSVKPSCHPRQRSVAVIHTHTNGIPYGEDTDNFSYTDIDNANSDNIPSYLVLPFGELMKYDPTIPLLGSGRQSRVPASNVPNLYNYQNFTVDKPISTVDFFIDNISTFFSTLGSD